MNSGYSERVGVFGGGIMGTGIAKVCVKAALDVRLVEVSATRWATAPIPG